MRHSSLELCLLVLGLVLAGQPGYALPKFAREYGVGCQHCHSIAPRLNAFGLAFQANHFNWPGGNPPTKRSDLKAILPSAVAAFRYADSRSQEERSAQFEELQLFFAGGLQVSDQRPAGYMASMLVASKEEK